MNYEIHTINFQVALTVALKYEELIAMLNKIL